MQTVWNDPMAWAYWIACTLLGITIGLLCRGCAS